MIAMVLAMLSKPNRLKPKTTTCVCFAGYFFLTQLLLIPIIVLQNVAKKLLQLEKKALQR